MEVVEEHHDPRGQKLASAGVDAELFQEVVMEASVAGPLLKKAFVSEAVSGVGAAPQQEWSRGPRAHRPAWPHCSWHSCGAP